jgi:hypothetical protein
MTSTATIMPLDLEEGQKQSHEGGDYTGSGRGRMLSLVHEEERPKEEHSHAEDSFLDKTLVNETATSAGSPAKHAKSSSNGSVPSIHPRQSTALEEPWDITKWKPSGPTSHQQDATLVNHDNNSGKGYGKEGVEGDVADATVLQLANAEHGMDEGDGVKKLELVQPPSFSISRRPSALLVSSKAPSPQPWDLVDPPEDNMKGRTLPESVAYQLPASGSGKFVDNQLTA